MKRLLSLALFGLLLSSPRFVSAQEAWSIPDYHADITVNTDASIDVHETIKVVFSEDRHGIFRDIPTTATFNGKKVALPITAINILQDGKPAIVDQSKNSSMLKLTIGNPDELITGSHVYDIRYHVTGAVNFFDTFDELNWNVTGNAWPIELTKVSATLHVPGAVTPTTLCYTGPKGSTVQNCTGVATEGEARYSASDTLTVISHWPKGVVTKPLSYDQSRQVSVADQLLWWGSWVAAILLALGTFVFMFRHWSEKGKDPDEPKTVIAQYEPPTGVLPAEATVIYGQNVSSKAITATIIDLAVRGYLRIEEREHQNFFGKKKDFALFRVKPEDETLRDYEKAILQMLFASKESQDETGTTLLSVMKKHVSKISVMVEAIRSGIAEGVNARGYFIGNPVTTVAKYSIISTVMIAVPIYVFADLMDRVPTWVLVLMGGVVAAGASIGGFGLFMSRRSEIGAKAHWQLKGFKLYLTTAEKYRVQWQEDNHIFEKFLPYAIAFGVAEKWSKTFADVSMPKPDWYSGSGNWNSIYAWHALNSFSTSFSSSTVPSGGGSSGGGSGGGGGGGGGGSW